MSHTAYWWAYVLLNDMIIGVSTNEKKPKRFVAELVGWAVFN